MAGTDCRTGACAADLDGIWYPEFSDETVEVRISGIPKIVVTDRLSGEDLDVSNIVADQSGVRFEARTSSDGWFTYRQLIPVGEGRANIAISHVMKWEPHRYETDEEVQLREGVLPTSRVDDDDRGDVNNVIGEWRSPASGDRFRICKTGERWSVEANDSEDLVVTNIRQQGTELRFTTIDPSTGNKSYFAVVATRTGDVVAETTTVWRLLRFPTPSLFSS